MTEDPLHNVGGVLLPRPFRVSRLGHFGFNVRELKNDLPFYRDDVGFMVSDTVNFRDKAPNPALLDGVEDTRGYFLRHGTDHHSFVLFGEAAYRRMAKDSPFGEDVSTNQITFQVGSLKQVVDAIEYLRGRGAVIRRSGRDIPGSNWHSYFYDPDGHVIELYYGIEQIGWNGVSKPKDAHLREYHQAPDLPQIPEYQEIDRALAQGARIEGGYRHKERLPAVFDVEGVMLARPFKVVRIGPVSLFVADLDASRRYYEELLGLEVSYEGVWKGRRFLMLRCNTEHHTIALYEKSLRAALPVRQDDTCLSFGVQVASYAQLRAARDWLRDRKIELVDIPHELSPGVSHAFHARTPNGHLLQFYWHMAQIAAPQRAVCDFANYRDWPETVAAPEDAYRGEVMLGPWS